MRARPGSTVVVSMVSELSKTAISRMRVAELKQELANRGLESDGIRPVLQARLGQGERSISCAAVFRTFRPCRDSGARLYAWCTHYLRHGNFAIVFGTVSPMHCPEPIFARLLIVLQLK